jgi:hypothetical protein
MDLGNITSTLNSATNLTNTVRNTVTNLGNANSLSGVLNSVTGVFDSLGKFFKTLEGTQLPLPNPLNAYATYDYILTLACLSKDEVNNPEATYMATGPQTIICKSANASPDNRVNTVYGKFDFFFQNLTFDSSTQLDDNVTSTYDLHFTILEPYSMGLFFEAIQTAADANGWDNWRNAPFVIVIEFRGNKETGTMTNIQGLSRYIPFDFYDFQMDINHIGAIYTCKGNPQNMQALTDSVSALPTDVTTTGTTVAEMLQYGDNSLQRVLNQFEKQKVDKGYQTTANEYVIIFPNDISSSDSTVSPGDSEADTGATADPSVYNSSEMPSGLFAEGSSENLQQSQADINEIGKADMQADTDRPGDQPIGRDDKIYDSASKTFFGGKLNVAPTVATSKFDQKSNIANAIKQVILRSSYVKDKLDASSLSEEGYRQWYRISVQTKPLSTEADTNGTVPCRYIYRITPYNTHSSRLKAQGYRAPGLDGALQAQVVKQYDYIYTGKNDNILSVKINLNNSFMNVLPADGGMENSDARSLFTEGSAAEDKLANNLTLSASKPNTAPGATSSILKYVGSLFKSDAKGGGGLDTPATRAARTFHDAITSDTDTISIDLEIMGDPYYIAHSGLGNYSSSPSQYINLNQDGSINYENGEVDILINFRTPIDINQTTGLYNFGPNSKTAPVIRFSGLYCVNTIKSTMADGKFKQVINAFRRPDQENTGPATATDAERALFGSNAIPDKQNPSGSSTEEESDT